MFYLFVNLQVKDVRTNDDTMITVKLMLFYELKDILKMVSCYCLCLFYLFGLMLNIPVNRLCQDVQVT